MNQISTIPAAAAQFFGGESFFGSCQVAAGNFEAVLQSITSQVPVELGEGGVENVSMQEFKGALQKFSVKDFLEFMEGQDENQVLARLQEILGEDGASALEDVMNLLEKSKQSVLEGSDEPELLDAVFALMHLQKMLDPKNISITPLDVLKARLEKCIEDVKEKLGNDVPEQVKDLLPEDMKDYAKEISYIKRLSEEMGITEPEDLAKFQEAIISLLDSGAITFQDLKAAVKIPPDIQPSDLTELVFSDETEPVREVLESLWKFIKTESKNSDSESKTDTNIKSEAKTETKTEAKSSLGIDISNLLSKFREIATLKSFVSERTIDFADFEKLAEIPQKTNLDTIINMDVNDFINVMNLAEEVDVPKEERAEFIVLVVNLLESGLLDTKDLESAAEKPTPVREILVKIWDAVEETDETVIDSEVPESAQAPRDTAKILQSQMSVADNSSWKDIAQDNEVVKNLLVLLKKVKNNEVLTPEEKTELKALMQKPEKAEGAPAEAEEDLDLDLDVKPERRFARANTEQNKKEDLDFTRVVENTQNKEKAAPAKAQPQPPQMINQPAQATQAAQPTQATQAAQPMQQPQPEQQTKQAEQPQPEIRAVWEGGGLKIEEINPKTGERVQVIHNSIPQNMQERIQEFEVIKQVVAHARFISTPTGEQKMTIQLRPDHLGQVDLRIVLNNGEMQIHARVESVAAQAALETHIGLLREGLEKQGVALDRLEVSVEQREREQFFSLEERREQQEHRRGHHKRHRNREHNVAISAQKDQNADTGRRLGYNTMEYLA